MNDKIEKSELNAWGNYIIDYFLDVLNKEKDLEECIEDIKSFRNSKYYTGTQEKFKIIKEN